MAAKGYRPMVVAVLEAADKQAMEAAALSGRKASRMLMLDVLRSLSDTLVNGSKDLRGSV